MSFLKTTSLSASVGLILGIMAVIFVEPATDGGVGVILLVCVTASTVAGHLIRLVRKPRDNETPQ